MKIHRVIHKSIPVEAFKSHGKHGNTSRILRWYHHEHLKQPDCSLRVENERDGTFELWMDYPATVQPTSNKTGVETVSILTGGSDILSQSIVDEIELVPAHALIPGCDFVIFQDSPQTKKSYTAKGQ